MDEREFEIGDFRLYDDYENEDEDEDDCLTGFQCTSRKRQGVWGMNGTNGTNGAKESFKIGDFRLHADYENENEDD